MEACTEAWKNVVISSIGKHGKGKWKEIACSIVAVDQGLKPSYLYDATAACMETLHQLLQVAQSKNLISNGLVVLHLEEDFFIVNQAVCVEYLDKISASNVPLLLDQKCGLILNDTERKEIITEIVNLFKEELCHKKLASVDKAAVTLPGHMDGTTVYGILVGYPVVYWTNCSHSNIDNISNCELTCVKIKVPMLGLGSQELYSFSYLRNVHADVQNHIDVWFSDICAKHTSYCFSKHSEHRQLYVMVM